MFLEEAARELGLDSVHVVAQRIELLGEREPVDAITLRGVRMTDARFQQAWSWLRPGGRLLWFSGEERLAAASAALSRRFLVNEKGPLPLLPGGRASVLVLEKRALEGECFT